MTHPKTSHPAPPPGVAEVARRRIAMLEGVASAAIEGGDVGAEARAIMAEWAEGHIDKATMIQRVLDLDEPA